MNTSFIEEFRAFAMKGNVVELAVAVVIGTAFGKIVSSFVDNLIMPLVGALLGGIDLTRYAMTIGNAEVTYGVFLQSVVHFLIIALAIFVALKVINRLQRKEAEKPEAEKTVEPSEEVKLLREIRDSLQ